MKHEPVTTQHDPHDTLDPVLCTELFWQAPPELTHKLLELIPGTPADNTLPEATFVPPPAAPARPSTWYVVLVSILTSVAVALSLMVTWRFYGIVSAELGLLAWWDNVNMMLSAWLNWLYTELPATHYLVEALKQVHAQLHWLLIAVVLWLALDGATPRGTLQQQQASG
jgi:F0F1-type ATP synthase assembly protein I